MMRAYMDVFSWTTLRKLFIFLWFILFFLLLATAIYSGYRYSFYGDELVHMHTAYLIAHGYRPFTDFFTIYSPIFHIALSPFVFLFGANFQTVWIVRGVMVALFLLRLTVGWKFVSELFGKHTAWVFILFMVLDPFTVFSGMQIRPDNLALTLVFIGFYLIIRAIKTLHHAVFACAGVVLGLAFLVSIKLSFIIGVMGLLVFWYAWRHRRWKICIYFILGCSIPCIAFGLYYHIQGIFMEMVTHLIWYSKAMSNGLWYPTRFGFFYQPGNTYIYGLGGKPMTWYIAMALPALAVFGFITSCIRFWRKPLLPWVIAFFLMAIVEYAFFLTVKSMFIQYYLGVNWVLAFFSSIFFVSLYTGFSKRKVLQGIVEGGSVLLLCTLTIPSMKANMLRSGAIDTTVEDTRMAYRWHAIGERDEVFPGLLFRPLAYPIPYGYFFPEVPESIRRQFMSLDNLIVQKRPKYLLVNDYTMRFIDQKTQYLIQNQYHIDPLDGELWVRNTEH